MPVPVMTPEEFAAKMRAIAAGGDVEGCHSEADGLMLEVLTQLGYGEGCRVFGDMEKWYA